MNATFIYVFFIHIFFIPILYTIQIKGCIAQWEQLKYLFIIFKCFILFTGILHYLWM